MPRDGMMSELDRQLLVLKAVAGIDRVYDGPNGRFDALKLNNNYVQCRVKRPDGQGFKTAMKKCGADRPDKLIAARMVKAQVSALLGAAGLLSKRPS